MTDYARLARAPGGLFFNMRKKCPNPNHPQVIGDTAAKILDSGDLNDEPNMVVQPGPASRDDYRTTINGVPRDWSRPKWLVYRDSPKHGRFRESAIDRPLGKTAVSQ